ncbi:MAG: cell envelope integrity protein CreD [Saprospiraceae bacterium]|nr:cell envelope integrity protein CreD [Saprospiraceae bacterium]
MTTTPIISSIPRFWNAPSFKLLAIAFLILLLLIPQNMLSDLIHEREFYKSEATMQVTEKWASAQTIAGPMLKIPVERTELIDKELHKIQSAYYILPEKFQANMAMETETRKKGFYNVPVYTSINDFKGEFLAAEIEKIKKSNEIILWKDIEMVIGIQDLKGIVGIPKLNVNGASLELSPANNDVSSGLKMMKASFPIEESAIANKGSFSFELSATIKGTNQMNLIPVGKSTKAELSGNWPHPGFEGAFLPMSHSINEEGFTAQYEVSHFNRAFAGILLSPFDPLVLQETMAIQMVVPADEYQLGMRAVKYCVLVIILIFMSLFLYESITRTNVHIIQYLLIGAAIIVFYALLIALSEVIGFTGAYISASIATILLIHLYMYSIVSKKRVNWLLSGIQCIILCFIAIVIHAQEMSLLMGSFGLFITLAAIMYTSRKIDWGFSGGSPQKLKESLME